jgi:hypothetical protein
LVIHPHTWASLLSFPAFASTSKSKEQDKPPSR